MKVERRTFDIPSHALPRHPLHPPFRRRPRPGNLRHRHLENHFTRIKGHRGGQRARRSKPSSPKPSVAPLDDARAYVTENGVPTGRRATSNAIVRDHGRGWFKVLRQNVRFSATDLTDPRTNGRHYAVHAPRPVPLALLGGLLALSAITLTLSFRRPTSPDPKDPDSDRFWIPKQKSAFANSGWLPFTIFLASSAVAAALLYFGSDFTDRGLTVKGMPYSDAEGWNEMAIALAEGRGFTTDFSTHRPFYSVFIGGLYHTFGPHLLIAKLINALSAGLLAASAFLLASRAFKSTAAGIALAAFLVLAPAHFKFLQITATEQLGLALTVFSIYLTWSAFVTRRPTLFLLAGLFLGLSNLTRTFTLLAFPLYGLILILLYIKVRPGWLTFIRHSALFAGGVILVFGPWIARQKVAHDITSISSNSADLIYGAAAYGQWDPRQYAEAQAAGIDPKPENNPVRHPFFNRRLAEVVKADPDRYRTFVTARFVEYLADSFDPSSPAFRLAAALIALAAALALCYRRRSPAGLLALAAVLPALAFLTQPEILTLNLPEADTASAQVPVPLIDPDKPTPAGALLLLAFAIPFACFPLRQNRVVAVLILVATLLGSAVLCALVGNFGITRTATFGGWIYLALTLAAITGIFQLAGTILDRFHPLGSKDDAPPAPHPASEPEPLDESHPDFENAPPTYHTDAFAITTGFLFLFISLAGILLIGLTYLGTLGKAQTPAWQLPQNHSAEIETWARSEFAAEIAAQPDGTLTVTPIILGDYRADLKAGEDVAHPSPIFAVGETPRTVAKVRSHTDPETGRGGMLLAVQFPGQLPRDLPRRKPFALVGIETELAKPRQHVPGNESKETEALALIPLLPDHSPDFTKAIRFPPSP